MNPLRCGFLIYGSPDQESGGYYYDRQLVNYLRNHGVRVVWISLDPEKEEPGNLAQVLGEIDILLMDELCHPHLVQFSSLITKVPKRIMLVHHLKFLEGWEESEERRLRHLEAQALQLAHALVVNSKHTLSESQKLLSSKLPYFLAYPAGNRYQREKSSGRQRAWKKVLCLGNIIPRKGQDLLLEAMELLDEDFHLDIVGRGNPEDPYFQGIQEKVKKARLRGRVNLHGGLSDEELQNLWQEVSALVVPSVLEGFGIVYLEALDRGIPVIAGSGGGVQEILTHGQGGYFLEPRSAEKLAELMRLVFESAEKWEKLSQQALVRGAQFPPWEKTFHGLEDFLANLSVEKAH